MLKNQIEDYTCTFANASTLLNNHGVTYLFILAFRKD